MILSDSAIFDALDDGRLVIDPEPSPRIPSIDQPIRPFDRSAVDLRLGKVLRIPKQGLAIVVDPGAGGVPNTLNALYDEEVISDHGYPLHPNRFVLGITEEYVKLTLPSDLPAEIAARGCLAARVEGKSSLARFGLLVHFTAPTIHAGFEGRITLEMMNLGPAPIYLRPHMPICQLIIEQVLGEPKAPPSQFHRQMRPTGME